MRKWSMTLLEIVNAETKAGWKCDNYELNLIYQCKSCNQFRWVGHHDTENYEQMQISKNHLRLEAWSEKQKSIFVICKDNFWLEINIIHNMSSLLLNLHSQLTETSKRPPHVLPYKYTRLQPATWKMVSMKISFCALISWYVLVNKMIWIWTTIKNTCIFNQGHEPHEYQHWFVSKVVHLE